MFYFEDLKQRKVCVQFLVNQEVCVEKTNPAIIKLYDYYNNQHATSVVGISNQKTQMFLKLGITCNSIRLGKKNCIIL